MSNRNAGTWNTMEKSRHAGSQRSVDLTTPASSTLRTPVHGSKKFPDLAEPPRAADVDCNNAVFRFSIIWPPSFNV